MTVKHRGRLTPDSPIEPGAAELRPLPQDPLPVVPDGWQEYWPQEPYLTSVSGGETEHAHPRYSGLRLTHTHVGGDAPHRHFGHPDED